MTSKKSASRNGPLNMADAMKLAKYLQSQEKLPNTLTRLSVQIKKDLDFTVGTTRLTDALKSLGLELSKDEKRPYKFHSSDLAREIVRIQESLGMDVDPAIRKLATSSRGT